MKRGPHLIMPADLEMISLLGLSHLPAVHVVIVAALATDSIAAAAVLHAVWFEVSSIFKLEWFCA